MSFDRIRATPESAAKLTSEHAKQHPRKDALDDSPFVKQPKGLLLRCSRPLCSSQQTARTPTPTSKADLGEGLKKPSPHPKTRQDRPVPQDPTACTHPTREPQSFQPPEDGVLNQNPWPGCLCQCSTHEQPASHKGPDPASTAKDPRAFRVAP